ncbi:hypothetical protein GGR58DRAFT_450951 [Xylaria digitata]|nr:hypothetical protein GGR58DRAFT_450951 [Xylaria digitata]
MATETPQADPSLLEAVPTLSTSVQDLGKLIANPDSDLPAKELPKLDELIDDYYNRDTGVSNEEFALRILQVFQQSTHKDVYEKVVNQLPSDQQDAVKAFVGKGLSAEEADQLLAQEIPVVAPLNVQTDEMRLFSWKSEPMVPERKYIKGATENLLFENWGRTVKHTPQITYYPENIKEVQTIVRDAVKNNQGVRVSGFRHSWAPVFGRNDIKNQKHNGSVLISTLTERNASVLPNFTSLPSSLFQPKETELNHISVVDAAYVGVQRPLTGGKKYVRVGTATTNEQFRRWCIDEGNVTLPMNIIEVEITFGGSNATICHGAGMQHSTLSDLVRCIEYVNAKGDLCKVNMADPELMKAASGCFGLLGVVTHITFECDAMLTAVMRPVKLDAIEAIPPPPGMKDSDIPAPLWKARTAEQKKIDQQNFERRANNDFYAEWFWFPYSTKVWVNTWSTDASTKNVVNYPSNKDVFLQVAETAFMNMAQEILHSVNALQARPQMQTAVLSWLAMRNLDERKENQKPIRTLLPNALHFQRGVQNIRVRDLEVELPLHAKKGTTTERDYTNVQRAWWDAIRACYEHAETSPMRMPLEMRMMGSSSVTMAPQRGNKLGTCAIEILTLKVVSDIWEPFAQKVLDKWVGYRDNDGRPVVIKPHWAKEWYNYQVDGAPWVRKLKNEVYRDQIAEFRALLAAIGKKHNWTLADIKKTFSNELLDYLYLDDV